jgi:hypothetical protein
MKVEMKAVEGVKLNLAALKTILMKTARRLMRRKPAPRKRARSGKGTKTPVPTPKHTKL